MRKFLTMFLFVGLLMGIASCTNDITTITTNTTTELQTTQVPTTKLPTTTEKNLPPVFVGVEDREVNIDSSVDFLEGITIEDPEAEELLSKVLVNSGDFDASVEGTYLIILTLVDAGNNTVEASYTITVINYEKVMVEGELDKLNITLDDLIINPKLPVATPDFSVQFTWTSDKPSVITHDGFVNNPPVGFDAVTVVLTVEASVYGGNYSASKTFSFTVEPNAEIEISEKRNYEFIGTSEEYVVLDLIEFPLYFITDGSIPYVDIESFFGLVEGAVEPDLLQFTMIEEDIMKLEYVSTYLDLDGVTEITETYTARLDFTNNTLTVNNFDFFAGYAASTESDYGEGLNYVDADYVDGVEVVIPLGRYNIDLTTYLDGIDTVYLMPLHIANILFMSDIYYQVYFNGDKIYGVDTFALSDKDETIIQMIHESTFNQKEMTTEVKLASYNSLALIMDYFYGLKPERNYDTYYTRLQASMKSIVTGSDNNLYNKIFALMYGMDDLHTSHTFYGYYDGRALSGLSISDLGPRSTSFYNGLWAVQDLLTAKFGGVDESDIPPYSLIDGGKVAVIHITGFTIDTPDAFKAIMEALPATVEDVVIDLSYNTGGNIGAVLRIFGYITEEQYMYHSQNPADGSAVTYYLESDYVAYDYNWYVLTSSVTFSAANMFASMAKELNIPVIGQKSSGGASSIGSFITPDGSAIMISTNNVLSARVGNAVDGYEYISVESGVDVDYKINDVTSNSQLINAIALHKDSVNSGE